MILLSSGDISMISISGIESGRGEVGVVSSSAAAFDLSIRNDFL